MIMHPLLSSNLPLIPFILRANYPDYPWHILTTIIICLIPSGAVT